MWTAKSFRHEHVVGGTHFRAGLGGGAAGSSALSGWDRRMRRCGPLVAAFVCAVLLGHQGASGQLQHVLNGSFEEYTECPDGVSQIKRAEPWKKAGTGTTDYYNWCAGSQPWGVGVPENFLGYQWARTGGAYAGFIAWDAGDEWYEYVQQEFDMNLMGGLTYNVEVFVSWADEARYATDSIGIYLSKHRPYRLDSKQLSKTPQVINPPGQVITNDDGWTLISGFYTAQGDEKWITIGNFKSDVPRTLLDLEDDEHHSPYAYYYVEDVSVCWPPVIASFTLSASVCLGDPVWLNPAPTPAVNCFLEVYRVDQWGGEAVIQWCFGDWISCPGGPIDLTSYCEFAEPGVYRVKYAVQNDCTNWSEDLNWVTVQACCGFGVTLSPPGPISSCDPVELSAVVSGGTGPYQYTWMVVSLLGSFAQLLPEDSDTLLITGPESGADYVVCVTDAYGCQACSDRVWVTIETGVASYELAQTVCEGDVVWVDATASIAESYWLEIYETDAVGSDVIVGSWYGVGFLGHPGLLALNDEVDPLYPFPFEAGKIYRVTLGVDACGVDADKVQYVLITCCPDCTDPPAGMVGWWSGEGTAEDLSVHENHGVLAGGAGYGPGKVGDALTFAASDDLVYVADHASLNFGPAVEGQPGSGDFSIDAWVKSCCAADVAYIVQKIAYAGVRETSATGYVFWLLNNDTLVLEFFDGSGDAFALSDAGLAFSDGQWHHVAVTVDRDHPEGTRFYFDGQEIGRADPTPAGGDLTTGALLVIGAAEKGQPPVEQLDEVEIFHRALSEPEISAIYLADAAGKCKEPRCSVPGVVGFCQDDSSVEVTLKICNDSSVDNFYSFAFHGLQGQGGQTGQGCNVHGPISFSPEEGTGWVNAGECETVTVTIDRPEGLTEAGTTACYLVTVENLMTGTCATCSGKVKAVGLCFRPADPGGWDLIGLPWGGCGKVRFVVENLDDPLGVLDYELAAVPADGDPFDAVLSLNGQAPGAFTAGSVSVPMGSSKTISVALKYTQEQSFGFHEVILFSDVDGNGIIEPVASVPLRSILPPPCGLAFHCSARNLDDDNQVWLFDQNGVWTGQKYTQIAGAAQSTWGYRDGASSGEHVYFGWEDGVARHDPDGSNAVLLFGPGGAPDGCWRALAYDPTGDSGNGSLWSANWDSHLVEVSLSGAMLNLFPNDGWSLFGLAYDQSDGNLWGHDTDGQVIKIDTSTGTIIPGAGWPVSPDWTLFTVQGGLSGMHDGTGNLAAVCQGTPDELGVYDLSGTLIGGPWDMDGQTGTVGNLGVAVIYVECLFPAVDGDFDGDGDMDLVDFGLLVQCLNGPDNPPADTCPAHMDADFDCDIDVDLADFAEFMLVFGGG